MSPRQPAPSGAAGHVAAELPRVLHAPLRAIRTAALVALEPLDWLHRRLVGQTGLPPLWLRRHVGPLGGLERATGEISATIAMLDLVTPSSTVLDLGCGVGAMVPTFQRFLAVDGRYVGFDVHAPSIDWCRRRFANDARIRFELAAIRTPYSAGGAGEAASYHFPVEDASVDFALAKSLFTHLLEEEAAHYLRELRRALRPGGGALVSAFLLDEESRARENGTPALHYFAFGNERARWLVRDRPAAGIALQQTAFTEMCRAAGLAVRRVIHGYWRGGACAAPNAQDLVVLGADRAG